MGITGSPAVCLDGLTQARVRCNGRRNEWHLDLMLPTVVVKMSHGYDNMGEIAYGKAGNGEASACSVRSITTSRLFMWRDKLPRAASSWIWNLKSWLD